MVNSATIRSLIDLATEELRNAVGRGDKSLSFRLFNEIQDLKLQLTILEEIEHDKRTKLSNGNS